MEIPKQFLIVMCFLTSTGCSSLLSRTGVARGTGMVYPGAREDFAVLKLTLSNRPSECEGGAGTYSFFLVYGLVDLPFSFAADTICLPYDIATLGRQSEKISYGVYNYRIFKTDKTGLPRGKHLYKFRDPSNNAISGFAHYKHGILDGKTEIRGLGNETIQGEYNKGKPWSGGILLNATDIGCHVVGPLSYYENGHEIGSSNLVISLPQISTRRTTKPSFVQGEHSTR